MESTHSDRHDDVPSRRVQFEYGFSQRVGRVCGGMYRSVGFRKIYTWLNKRKRGKYSSFQYTTAGKGTTPFALLFSRATETDFGYSLPTVKCTAVRVFVRRTVAVISLGTGEC